jgi:hypothetical protein
MRGRGVFGHPPRRCQNFLQQRGSRLCWNPGGFQDAKGGFLLRRLSIRRRSAWRGSPAARNSKLSQRPSQDGAEA